MVVNIKHFHRQQQLQARERIMWNKFLKATLQHFILKHSLIRLHFRNQFFLYYVYKFDDNCPFSKIYYKSYQQTCINIQNYLYFQNLENTVKNSSKYRLSIKVLNYSLLSFVFRFENIND